MTVSNLRAETCEENGDFRARMRAHGLNGMRPLTSSSADAAMETTAHIHALATYIATLVPERENTRYLAGERPVDHLNPEIVAGAFGAIAHLAAQANFYAYEAACEGRAD